MSITLTSALILSNRDYSHLVIGRNITWVTGFFMPIGQSFALTSTVILSPPSIVFWGECTQCQSIESIEDLPQLAQLINWDLDQLKAQFQSQQIILVACIRVYQLSQPLEIKPSKTSGFIPLDPTIIVDKSNPVIPENIFQRRKLELTDLSVPQHWKLIQLEEILTKSVSLPLVEPLVNKIHQFLGWRSSPALISDPDLLWVTDIANIGNSSDGNNFEKIVRKSLILLGFDNSLNNKQASLNPDATGGAGGLDFYCDFPYSVVGECKASKTDSVPDGTPAQLVKLGLKILGEHYHHCIKILMVAGKLTSPANITAQGNRMNVIRPETLQKLVQLQIDYPGSIDLLALKPYLTSEPFGEAADDKVNMFITNIHSKLQLRSSVIELVKTSLERSGKDLDSVTALYSAFTFNQYKHKLSEQQFRDILVELSSPLTGYLGKSEDEQFYFLRSLEFIEQT
jgi:Domain of unknown function (DUF1802)